VKILAALAILANVAFYLALMRVDPEYGFFHPRGGLAMIAVSYCVAWLGIHAAGQAHRPLDERFQYGVAAWIWLLVLAGCTLYAYWSFVSA